MEITEEEKRAYEVLVADYEKLTGKIPEYKPAFDGSYARKHFKHFIGETIEETDILKSYITITKTPEDAIQSLIIKVDIPSKKLKIPFIKTKICPFARGPERLNAEKERVYEFVGFLRDITMEFEYPMDVFKDLIKYYKENLGFNETKEFGGVMEYYKQVGEFEEEGKKHNEFLGLKDYPPERSNDYKTGYLRLWIPSDALNQPSTSPIITISEIKVDDRYSSTKEICEILDLHQGHLEKIIV